MMNADCLGMMQTCPERSVFEIIGIQAGFQEVHRLTGDVDYLMKVKVANSRAFDAFYKRFIGRINMFSVTSALTMETLKEGTELAL